MEGVRPATPGDLDRCAELLAAARDGTAAGRGGALLRTHGADATVPPADEAAGTAVARWSADPRSVLMAGLFEEAVVGVAAGTAHGPVGVVECCYVEPPARGVGVGTALAEGLVAWFTEQGCTGIDAWALPGDRATKQLLEGAGFSARLLVLHRRLP